MPLLNGIRDGFQLFEKTINLVKANPRINLETVVDSLTKIWYADFLKVVEGTLGYRKVSVLPAQPRVLPWEMVQLYSSLQDAKLRLVQALKALRRRTSVENGTPSQRHGRLIGRSSTSSRASKIAITMICCKTR